MIRNKDNVSIKKNFIKKMNFEKNRIGKKMIALRTMKNTKNFNRLIKKTFCFILFVEINEKS
jgi:hypothetical protein